MITKPKNWDHLWAMDGTICEYEIRIGEDSYTGERDIELDSLKLQKPIFSADKLIGNCPCFSMECCIRQGERIIPRGAVLKLFIRLVNKTEKTDYALLGTFKVYNRYKYPDGWVKLNCRDKMQMANQPYFQSEVQEGSWPQPMKSVLEYTTARVGIRLDPRSVIMEGADWQVTPPVGLSIRGVWSYIAAAHGGNFVITSEDTLLLVQPFANPGNPVYVSASWEGLEVLGEPVTVDQLGFQVNSEYTVFSGTSGPNDILIECPYANQTTADYAKALLSGVLYHPMQVSDAVFDPAAEPFDSYLCNGLLTTWSESTVTCGLTSSVEATAVAMSEPENEYGFEDTPTNQLKRYTDNTASQLKVYADASSEHAVASQTQKDIFNKLTGNGKAQGIYILNGQLYINASYLRSGILSAEVVKLLGEFEVYSGDQKGGHIGYMKGSTGQQDTHGIGVSNLRSDCSVVVTEAGVAVKAGAYDIHLIKAGRARFRCDVTIDGDVTVNGVVRANDFIKTTRAVNPW